MKTANLHSLPNRGGANLLVRPDLLCLLRPNPSKSNLIRPNPTKKYFRSISSAPILHLYSDKFGYSRLFSPFFSLGGPLSSRSLSAACGGEGQGEVVQSSKALSKILVPRSRISRFAFPVNHALRTGMFRPFRLFHQRFTVCSTSQTLVHQGRSRAFHLVPRYSAIIFFHSPIHQIRNPQFPRKSLISRFPTTCSSEFSRLLCLFAANYPLRMVRVFRGLLPPTINCLKLVS